jgi:hypothetical protein
MKTPNLDVDPFIEALRVDLPNAADEARVRTRLLAAGVVVAGAAVTTSSGAASLAVGSGSSGAVGAAPGALNGAVVSGAVNGAVVSGAVASGAAASGAVVSGAAASGAVASGVAASGAAVSSAAGGLGAVGGLGTAGAPVAALKVGLLSKVLVLPVAAKLGVAATLAVAVAATSVPLVLSPDEPEASANSSAVAARATSRDGAATVVSTSRASNVDARAVDGARQDAPAAEAAPVIASPASPVPDVIALDAVTGDAITAGERATTDSDPAAGGPAVGTNAVNSRQERRQKTSSVRSSRADRVATRPSAAATARRRARAVLESEGDPERSSAKRSTLDSAADGSSPSDVGSLDRGRTEMVLESTLGEETRLLEQAMLALGEADRNLARRSLDEHARRFPDGLLVRERERARGRLRQLDADPR